MPTLQVRDLPTELYNQLNCLAEQEHRSLAQQTIVVLKKGIENRMGNRERRNRLIASFGGLDVDASSIPPPEELVRADRDTR